jgi:hypothetical protein
MVTAVGIRVNFLLKCNLLIYIKSVTEICITGEMVIFSLHVMYAYAVYSKFYMCKYLKWHATDFFYN